MPALIRCSVSEAVVSQAVSFKVGRAKVGREDLKTC